MKDELALVHHSARAVATTPRRGAFVQLGEVIGMGVIFSLCQKNIEMGSTLNTALKQHARRLVASMQGAMGVHSSLLDRYRNYIKMWKNNDKVSTVRDTMAAGVVMSARILLVDDSRVARSVIKVSLMGHDIEFIESANGQQALEQLAQTHVDLVISDLNMPTIDGLEFIKQVRSLEPPRCRVPIVLLTATKAFEAARRDCTRAGATEFLMKPVSSANLASVIQKYLPRRSAAR